MPVMDDAWDIDDAAELYEVSRWGQGYFSVGKNGHLRVHPERDPERSIDFPELIEQLQLRGLELPLIVRFSGILKDRLREIYDAFQHAIKEYRYEGGYNCVYPIKVNQHRQVVEEVLEYGAGLGFGLEAGSKPELLAVIAVTSNETPIVCNGFKDVEFIETALSAQKIGRNITIVVEKPKELDLILSVAARLGVRPQIGMRVKLSSRGSGRWQGSGGYRSKFGLTASEILHGLDRLKSEGMEDCLNLLHFHLGSQITNIRFVKSALVEAARIYADLVRKGAGLKSLDVGGGLGVDYDGSRTDFDSSMNYTLQEYANDVIYQIKSVCDDAKVPHPNIVSESGRAISAYHSVLLFSVMGAVTRGEAKFPREIPEDTPQPLRDLFYTRKKITLRNAHESYHDALQLREMVMSRFLSGVLSLEDCSFADDLFWGICRRINKLTQEMEFVPEELQKLGAMLSDTYFCNFSVFQSMPDSWAIQQLFPVMPLHRLEQPPSRRAVLGDITCDSDGKLDRFIDRRDVKRALPLHAFDGQPYHLGAFLVGAYQEVLGDLHNLFGNPHVVHVDINEGGEVVIKTVVRGERVDEVLAYVEFDSEELLDQLQRSVEEAVLKKRVTHQEAGQFLRSYESSLRNYTYLERFTDAS
ncbi:biosynthetic arginine decarboxylase [Thalassoroseus pseudoceratinae]|uniref:biosynthetic arginine decarboxylase n=1 Tax=Thalassoroseus pseudoceratinae TaxID=2713176 RepID=UPI00141EEA00|nr:biosynthetic arginine decarboxylase [Thalassoroseus pseudoceratinae]